MADEGFDAAALRKEYAGRGLDRADLDDDPITQLLAWIDDARAAGVPEPNAMVLATAAADGAPSARTMLAKAIDARGAAFHTNLTSRKARELTANPRASGVFYWGEVERQVILEGPVTRVDDEEADAMFAARPPRARLAAHASAQDRPVAGREELEQRLDAARARVGDDPARPPWYGAFRLTPVRVEFWQGGRDRVHDRFGYVCVDGEWEISRLAP